MLFASIRVAALAKRVNKELPWGGRQIVGGKIKASQEVDHHKADDNQSRKVSLSDCHFSGVIHGNIQKEVHRDNAENYPKRYFNVWQIAVTEIAGDCQNQYCHGACFEQRINNVEVRRVCES